MRQLELLSPAADKTVAREAILHGADAVYMGGPSHGARKNASNSIDDILETVDFAHRFRAKVYVTVNTLVYENELRDVERLVRDLYHAGVDALIVQDMSLLRLEIPPIALHASTQCDTRTVEKARFLEEVGFSQIVTARELTIEELRKICSSVSVPVECFVHGALCVSYSGRCGASQACFSRSANRGACAQICRLPFTLYNSHGEILEKDKHLLSLRDLNASESVPRLIEAGVSSFKIEGRLKEAGYVKNVTAAYRRIIDDYISRYPDSYCRSSYGNTSLTFEPNLSKSFNRGFTEYFMNSREPDKMASLLTPKSMGEEIKDVLELHNGDGISFFNAEGIYEGVKVNRIENGNILGSRRFRIPKGGKIFRTFDNEWQKQLGKPSAVRKIRLDVEVDPTGISASDERGVRVRAPMEANIEKAEKPQDLRSVFDKFGNTDYSLGSFTVNLPDGSYLPPSAVSRMRRRLVDSLDSANRMTYRFDYRRRENRDYPYPSEILDSRDNVANSISEEFYRSHGARDMKKSLETSGKVRNGTVVMTTRYCLRRELGCCKKDRSVDKNKSRMFSEPLSIVSGNNRFTLDFDCGRCEMNVILDREWRNNKK